jgi:predicted restriction endonuclease
MSGYVCKKCGGTDRYEHQAAKRVYRGCIACRAAASQKSYSRVGQKEKRTDYRRQLKQAVLAEYGGQCACCGEDTPEFLSVDHVDNSGAEHRRKIGRSGLYWWLKKHNYPKDNFRLLCFNCNCARDKFGVCPHEKARHHNAA